MRRITTAAMAGTIFSTLAGVKNNHIYDGGGNDCNSDGKFSRLVLMVVVLMDLFLMLQRQQVKYLITLPSVSELITPLFITIERNFGKGGNDILDNRI